MPISHSVELVDAATALQWLEHNKRNRPVSNAATCVLILDDEMTRERVCVDCAVTA